MGVFDRIFAALAGEGPKPERIMIDATHLKARRNAASLLKKGCSPPYRANKGSKLQHARLNLLVHRGNRQATNGADDALSALAREGPNSRRSNMEPARLAGLG
jgi:hypothetical protein